MEVRLRQPLPDGLREWLENTTVSSCLHSLSQVLDEKLLNGLDHVDILFYQFSVQETCPISQDGQITVALPQPVWTQACFSRFLALKHPETNTLHSSAAFLWRIFTYFGYYPFPAPTATEDSGKDGAVVLDRQAFRRAFALFVMRGVELFWYRMESPFNRKYNYHGGALDAKFALLWDMAFDCCLPVLNSSLEEKTLPSPEFRPQDDYRVQAVADTLSLIQPKFRHKHSLFVCIGCMCVRDIDHFEAAAIRLLQTCNEQSKGRIICNAIPPEDFRILVQTLLLIRPSVKCWREGPSRTHKIGTSSYTKYETGDANYAIIESSKEEEAAASNLASNFIEPHFGGENGQHAISRDMLQEWQTQFPRHLFYLFELGTALFAPCDPHLPAPQSGPSLTTINSLMLLNAAKFTLGPNTRYPVPERHIVNDLYSAALVLEAKTGLFPTGKQLHETLAHPLWLHYILVEGIDSTTAPASDFSKPTHRLAIFVNPHGEPPQTRQVSYEPKPQTYIDYAWHSTIVQSWPHLATADCGATETSIDGATGVVELRAIGLEDWRERPCEPQIAIRIDMHKKWIEFDGFDVDQAPPERPDADLARDESTQMLSRSGIRLTGLQCYRMPVEASYVTYSNPERNVWK